MKKRQEIGRGLRLCVNQDGERIKDNNINILTVMANESYNDFAKKLQSEMEKDTELNLALLKKQVLHILLWKIKMVKKRQLVSKIIRTIQSF